MALNKERLAFAGSNHSSYGDYAIDWPTGRKFVMPTGYLRVWEGGSVELVGDTNGHPEHRDEAQNFGIYIYMRDELPEISTIDGVRLPKAWLDKEIYVVDYPSRRVFAITGTAIGKEEGKYGRGSPPLGYRLRWAHPNSVPYSAYPACGWIPDRKKAKQWMEMNKDMLVMAKGIAALEGKYMVANFDYLCRVLLKTTPSQKELASVGASIGSMAFNKAVARITATRLSEPHLVLR